MKRSVNPFARLFMEVAVELMMRTGHGYRRMKMRHTGVGDDRRADKLEAAGRNKHLRAYYARYDSPRAR